MVSGTLAVRLVGIAAELIIDSDSHFEFAGHTFHVDQPPWAAPSPQSLSPRDRLFHALSLALYYGAYCRDPQTRLLVLPETLQPDHDFVARLSTANQSRATVEHGWQVVQHDVDGSLHVTKGGRFRIAARGNSIHASTDSGGPLYSLPVTVEERDAMPMFYFAHSESLPNQCDDLDNVRYYFNCDESSVAGVLGTLTSNLNRYDVPFRLKCMNHPVLYGRTDALVLYIEKRYAEFVSRLLRMLSGGGHLRLSPSVPLFTKRLVDGIGIAEDPGDGQSFGQLRSRLLAAGFLDANEAGRLHDDSVVDDVRRQFEQAGLDLSKPHLNAGSTDWYA